MSVKVRPYRRGGWEVDVRVHLPDGTLRRERQKISLTSRTAAQRWGEARERELLIHGAPKPRREVPTLADLEQRFIDGPSGRTARSRAGSPREAGSRS